MFMVTRFEFSYTSRWKYENYVAETLFSTRCYAPDWGYWVKRQVLSTKEGQVALLPSVRNRPDHLAYYTGCGLQDCGRIFENQGDGCSIMRGSQSEVVHLNQISFLLI